MGIINWLKTKADNLKAENAKLDEEIKKLKKEIVNELNEMPTTAICTPAFHEYKEDFDPHVFYAKFESVAPGYMQAAELNVAGISEIWGATSWSSITHKCELASDQPSWIVTGGAHEFTSWMWFPPHPKFLAFEKAKVRAANLDIERTADIYVLVFYGTPKGKEEEDD